MLLAERLPPRRQWKALPRIRLSGIGLPPSGHWKRWGRIHLAAVDVGDESAARHCWTSFNRIAGRPSEEHSCSGVPLGESLANLEAANVPGAASQSGRRLAAPQLLADQKLDFFVCFSSVAALVGQSGHGPYAAANAFLDALAQYRNHRGSVHQPELGRLGGLGWQFERRRLATPRAAGTRRSNPMRAWRLEAGLQHPSALVVLY
jgi:hypothetical protein